MRHQIAYGGLIANEHIVILVQVELITGSANGKCVAHSVLAQHMRTYVCTRTENPHIMHIMLAKKANAMGAMSYCGSFVL